MLESSLLADMRVLVADDESFSLSIVGRMLREMGCTDVVQAAGGAKAYASFQQDSPPGIRLAIVDFNMPDINGLQILKMIRTGQTAAPRDLPVLMLTGTADGGLVSAAAALDIGAFVVKPVSKATLGTRLAKALAEPRAAKPVEAYQRIDVDSVARALLAQDVRGPEGELLLSRGAMLSERFLRRLRDLSGPARIEYLLIEHPKKPDGMP